MTTTTEEFTAFLQGEIEQAEAAFTTNEADKAEWMAEASEALGTWADRFGHCATFDSLADDAGIPLVAGDYYIEETVTIKRRVPITARSKGGAQHRYDRNYSRFIDGTGAAHRWHSEGNHTVTVIPPTREPVEQPF